MPSTRREEMKEIRKKERNVKRKGQEGEGMEETRGESWSEKGTAKGNERGKEGMAERRRSAGPPRSATPPRAAAPPPGAGRGGRQGAAARSIKRDCTKRTCASRSSWLTTLWSHMLLIDCAHYL